MTDSAERDREGAERETRARSDKLHDLAVECDTESLRERAIESLEEVVQSHRPPPPRQWVRNL